MLPLVGFLPARDPRMLGTVARDRAASCCVDGFVQRYPDDPRLERSMGFRPGEGVFLPCTFWLVDNYALRAASVKRAMLFERLLAVRNDLGLLAEEYDPRRERLLGNFPQAFSHVALVNTAKNLSHADGPATDRSEHAKR